MKIIERIFCWVGRHDWLVNKEKSGRIDAEYFNKGSSGKDPSCFGLTCILPMVLFLLSGLLMLLIGYGEEADSVLTSGCGLIFLGIIWGWAASFVKRNRNWKDARCLRCGKPALELTERASKVETTEIFFKHLDEE